ncbi:MAG: hypothetical protein H0V54_10735 [Chthoniobacterales bacterium]|nr:hypothetical protein [Chthoniobacterales bacterium]
MSATDDGPTAPPDNAKRLAVGDTIEDGNLHGNATVKRWVAVTPQGEERVEPGQGRFYYRKNADH